MVSIFGRKKNNENIEKNEVGNILEDELKKKGYDISKYKLFILKIYKDNDYMYLPSVETKYLNMIIKSNEIKIKDIRELDNEILKIEVDSPELYDRVKSVMGLLKKFDQFGF